MSTETTCTCPSGDGSLRWPCPAHPSHMGHLHQHLLDMLGAKDHVEAGRIIGELHATALNEHSGNSGQLQQPGAAAGLNEPFGDSEQLGTDAGNGGDALDVPFAWTWISQAGERHVTTYERHARDVAGADGCVVHAITPQMLAARQPVGVDPVAEIIEEIAGDVESCVSDACGYLASDNGWRDYGIYRDDFTKRYHALPDRIRALAAPPAPEMSPDFTDTARAAISWVLWHHQGGSSAIGQPLRYALGMGDHEELSAQQISEAKRYAESVGARTDDFKQPAPAAVQTDFVEVATCDQESADGFQWLPGFTRSSFPTGAGVFVGQPPAAAAVPVDGDVARLQSVIERDRTAFCALIMQLKKVLQARSWMCEQHARAAGGYAYDEPGFIKEFGAAWEEIMAELHRVHSVFRDFADCPVDAGAVSAAQAEATTMLATHSQPAAVGDEARPMVTAPRDGTMLRLLVEFTDHATEDTNGAAWTIGANSFEETGEDQWQFAGWCWTHDHFTEGKGTPVGWLPLIDQQAKPEVR